MPYNGSGVFSRVYNWATDKANTVPVTASRMDGEDDGFATGLSTAICKDGQSTTTGRIPFALGASSMAGSTSAVSYAQNNDNNTGIYFPAADQVGIAAGGVAALTLTSTAATLYGQGLPFDAGTKMLFQQTAAPTGWTKQTTHNDKALRVVSGTASSGGSVAFTTALAAFNLAQNQLPNTTLSVSGTCPAATITGTAALAVASGAAGTNAQEYASGTPVAVYNTSVHLGMDAKALTSGATSSINGGVVQSAINLAVQYVDLIIASKD